MDEINRRILVIDDMAEIHVDYRRVLCPSHQPSTAHVLASEILGSDDSEFITTPDFIVDCATHGEEGLRMVEKAMAEGEPYAAAFVDVRMPPGWDGIETIKRIWQVDPFIQMTIVTAYSDYSWESICRELGATDQLLMLKKPFESIEILAIASSLTCKWDLMRRLNLAEKGITVADGQGETILLINLNRDALAIGKDLLEGLKYNVLTAANEQDGIALFNANRGTVNLVLIDAVMAPVDGIGAVRHLHEIAPELKVIFSTGFVQDNFQQPDRVSSATIITKPLDRHALSQMLHDALKK